MHAALLLSVVFTCIGVSHTQYDGYDGLEGMPDMEAMQQMMGEMGYGPPPGYGGDQEDPFVEISDEEELNVFLNPPEDVGGGLIGVFNLPQIVEDDDTDAEEPVIPKPDELLQQDLENFVETSQMLMGLGLRVGVVTNPDYVKAFKVKERDVENMKGGWKVFHYKDAAYCSEKYNEKPRSRFPGSSITMTSLAAFVAKVHAPLVSRVSETNYKLYPVENPVVVMFATLEEQTQYLANRMRKVAKEFENDATFVMVDHKDTVPNLRPANFDFPASDEPMDKRVIVGIRHGNKYYSMKEDFALDTLTSFVQQFVQGEIVDVKIQEHPDPNDPAAFDDDVESSVLRLEDEDVAEVIEERHLNVVIEFYAPWCKYCSEFAPEYEKVAEEFLDHSGVAVTKYEVSEEAPDFPGVTIEELPTILLFPKDSTDAPIPYEGERTAAALSAFLREQFQLDAAPESHDEL